MRSKLLIGITTLTLLLSSYNFRRTFEDTQKDFARVRMAYINKEPALKAACDKVGVNADSFGNLFIRIFKREKQMELWVQTPNQNFVKLKQYDICKMSGKLGPKRAQGDYQVPEGCYYINVFNPQSLYNLSLGINYPNESDKILSAASNRGGDIYIHGECASIGCIAMDNQIEEIYIAAVKAKSSGQEKIPVHIFPFRMSFRNFDEFSSFNLYRQHKDFWRNLSLVYWYFEKSNLLPDVIVDTKGRYQFVEETITKR